jgi:hypothetical protein
LNDMRRPRPWGELAMCATARQWHAAKRRLGAGNRGAHHPATSLTCLPTHHAQTAPHLQG